MPDIPGVHYDGDFSEASPFGGPIFETPFPADPKQYVYRQSYWQLRDSYTPAVIDDPGPAGGFCTGYDGNLCDLGGGLISYEREFPFLPDTHNENESFVYTHQFLIYTGFYITGVTELPLTRP